MKKILFATHSPFYIGGERSMWDVLVGIKDIYKVALLVPRGELYDMALRENIEVLEIPLSQSPIWKVKRNIFVPVFKKEILKITKGLKEIIKEFNPDIVYTHSMKMHLFFSPPFIRNGKKLVWHFRDIPEENSKYIFKTFSIFPDRIIAISKSVKKFFPFRNKIRVVYNGIKVPNEIRDNGIEKKKFTILSVGNIQYWKAQDLIIECAKRLKDFEFWIVGDSIHPGEEKFKQELLKKVKREKINNVIFWGKKNNVFPFYQKCDIFLHVPRVKEGFGRVVVEAMAMKKPIITTNVGAIPEILGNTGILTKKEDISDICNKILELYKNKKLRKKLAETGYKRYISIFTVEKMVKGVIRCLEEI